jgi:hypothetical protein
VTLLDAPGHKDFVPNMIMGAAQADAAVLVIDGSPGGFESSFHPSTPAHSGERCTPTGEGGQAREHVRVARSVGIKQIAVVVTKLDMCGYDKRRFDEVRTALAPFLAECGFREPQWLPACAPDGQNVTAPPTDARLSAWWPEGHTVIDAIDRFEDVARPVSAPPLVARAWGSPARASGAPTCAAAQDTVTCHIVGCECGITLCAHTAAVIPCSVLCLNDQSTRVGVLQRRERVFQMRLSWLC